MSWLVVQTKSNSESKAYLNLVRQNFEVFLPKILKAFSNSNKLKKIYKPLFPGYLFVKIKEGQNWIKINYTYGVKKMVTFGGDVPFINEELISHLKLGFSEKPVYETVEELKKNQRVFYMFKNEKFLKAVFEEKIDSKRSYIFLNFLKNNIKTKVKTKYLVPAV